MALICCIHSLEEPHCPIENILHIKAETGTLLSTAIYLSEKIAPQALCTGMGTCGRCRIRFLEKAPLPEAEDMAFFSSQLLEQGWRLGCQHHLHGTALVELPDFALPAEKIPTTPLPPQNKENKYYLGIDLGTTTLHYALCDEEGTVVLTKSMLNPQMGAGSDTVSRLAMAQSPQGHAQLHHITHQAMHNIIHQCAAMGGVRQACLAANPAMIALALNLPITGLAHAPYSLSYQGGTWQTLENMPPLWIPPQLSAFVGADISAGLAHILTSSPALKYPFILADLGTNGEFLLAMAPNEVVVTSVALGPALEGIGLRFGIHASPGTINKFSLSPAGLLPSYMDELAEQNTKTPITDELCHGITGTGYLSLIACLLKANAMTRSGHFTLEKSLLLKKHLQKQEKPQPESSPTVPLPHNFFLSPHDVEEILKVKAAFSLGLHMLIQHAGLQTADIQQMYIAGALGNHLPRGILEELGFMPHGMEERCHYIGNSSLYGACVLARSAKAQQELIRHLEHVNVLALAEHPDFMTNFPQHMHFLWQAATH